MIFFLKCSKIKAGGDALKEKDDEFNLDLELDFNVEDFDISIDTEEEDETRIVKPKFHKTTSEKHLCFNQYS